VIVFFSDNELVSAGVILWRYLGPVAPYSKAQSHVQCKCALHSTNVPACMIFTWSVTKQNDKQPPLPDWLHEWPQTTNTRCATAYQFVRKSNHLPHSYKMIKLFSSSDSNKHPMGCEAQLAWIRYSRPLCSAGDFDQ